MSARLSLRNIFVASLVVAVVIFVGLASLGAKAYSFYRTRQAEQYLESRGFYVVGNYGKNIEWSHFFRPRDQFIVHSPSPRSVILGLKYRALIEPADWRYIQQLGSLRELSVTGPQGNSADMYACLQRNKGTLAQLEVSFGTLTPELAAAISECQELRELVFRGVKTDPKNSSKFVIAPLPQLQSVQFEYAPVSPAHLKWLSDQPALARLTMSASLSDEIIGIVLSCDSLQDVDLGVTSVSPEGMRRLLAEGTFRGLTYSAVPLDESDLAALLNSRLERVGLQHANVTGSFVPLLSCERIVQLGISKPQFEKLVAADLNLTRETRLRLDVHGVMQFRDVPVNPWSSCVDLRRFDDAGCFIGERIASEVHE